MSLLIISDNTMIVDSRGVHMAHEVTFYRETRKYYKVENNKFYVAVIGNLVDFDEVGLHFDALTFYIARRFNDGTLTIEGLKEKIKTLGLHLLNDSAVYMVHRKGHIYFKDDVIKIVTNNKPLTAGSGFVLAFNALQMGATPMKAALIAQKHDGYVSGLVELNLDDLEVI